MLIILIVNQPSKGGQLISKRKILKPDKLLKYLDVEEKEIKNKIKKLQTEHYVNRKIPEEGYKFQLEVLSDNLADIEKERTTVDIEKGRKVVKDEEPLENGIFVWVKNKFNKMFRHKSSNNERRKIWKK